MSSIRSASSSTSTCTASSETSLRSTRSCRRPGVATITCAAFASFACALQRHAAVHRRDLIPSPAISSIASVTCTQSSRVGTSTSARAAARDGSSRSTIGIANASVLPEPVGLLARTSPPRSASGITSALDRERGFDAVRGQQLAHGLGNAEGTEICHLSQLLRTSRSCVRRRRRDLTGARPIRLP